jgi:hypothetical protein
MTETHPSRNDDHPIARAASHRGVTRRAPARRLAARAAWLAVVLLPALAPVAGAAGPGEETPATAEETPTATEETPAPEADAFDPGRRNPAAPPETEQFGRLAGIWDVEMAIRRDDGSWPEADGLLHAEWRFRYILDGWAVQDEWIAPAPHVPVEAGPRQLGTNIRIYDPEAGHWEIAWISNTQQTLSTLEAVVEEGDIVMTGTHASGLPQRVTFYDVTDDSFEWTLEIQGMGEDPDAWLEVARIHADRR